MHDPCLRGLNGFYVRLLSQTLGFSTWKGADDVRIAWISDRHAADTEVLSAGSAELCVVAGEVVHTGLGKHRIVLDLALSQGRAVVRNENELGFALAQCLQGLRMSEVVLATLDDERQPGGDRFCILGGLGGFLRWAGDHAQLTTVSGNETVLHRSRRLGDKGQTL